MSEYSAQLRFLYSLQKFGIKLGLYNIKALLDFCGHPERQYPCVHIAGTNGKGSTAAMIASILTASGYRTGLYTSPHLVTFNERIRIDGEKISDKAVAEYTKSLRRCIKAQNATFFEATTAIAFQYFADSKVDVAVIETGLGGRYDATNVVTPLVSIITSIGLEHTEHLGNTLAKIAYQKGGIIKPGVPCISGVREKTSLRVLEKIAQEKQSQFIQASKCVKVTVVDNALEGITVDVITNRHRYENLFVSLAGNHQTSNLLLALLAVEHIAARNGFSRISQQSIRQGLKNIRRFSGFCGRLDVLRKSPLIIADAAHNPHGVRAVCRSLKDLICGKVILLFGVMNDKDYCSMIRELHPMVRLAIAVTPAIARALPARVLVEQFHQLKIPAVAVGKISNGVSFALNEVRHNEPILITGSQYILGACMDFLKVVT